MRVSERVGQEHATEQVQGVGLGGIVNQLEATGGELWEYNEDTDMGETLLDHQKGRVMTAAAAGHPLAGQKIGSGEFPGWKEINGMQERARLIDARLTLASQP